MIDTIYFNLLVAHLVGDFYLQNDKFCEKKSRNVFSSWHLYVHALVIFALSWLATGSYRGWWLAAVVGVTHLLIDALKPALMKWWCKDSEKNELWVFLFDQILHIVVLWAVACSWLKCNGWQQFEWIADINPKYLLLATACAIAHKPSNLLVNLIIHYYEVPVPKDEADDNNESHGAFHSGSLIGTMERLLMIILIVMSQYEAMGFLIAAKSILRFSSVNGSEKSEYVVAGTFLSFGIALVLGLLVIHL